MRKFETDNTIQFKGRFYSFSGDLTDPAATPTITIFTSRGAKKIDAADMSKDSTGVYHYFWTPDTADKYLLRITGTVVGQTSLIRKAFKVETTSVD